jgi:hypothetical protein
VENEEDGGRRIDERWRNEKEKESWIWILKHYETKQWIGGIIDR